MSSKNSRVKIHVGRNQKFTSKNSRAKNSHGRQGLFPWAGFVGLFSRGRVVFRGRVPVVVFHVLTLAKVSTTNDNNNTKNACK